MPCLRSEERGTATTTTISWCSAIMTPPRPRGNWRHHRLSFNGTGANNRVPISNGRSAKSSGRAIEVPEMRRDRGRPRRAPRGGGPGGCSEGCVHCV